MATQWSLVEDEEALQRQLLFRKARKGDEKSQAGLTKDLWRVYHD